MLKNRKRKRTSNKKNYMNNGGYHHGKQAGDLMIGGVTAITGASLTGAVAKVI